jgi:4-hydroxyphenylpyruvate dioxygenase-like putative hemolysin
VTNAKKEARPFRIEQVGVVVKNLKDAMLKYSSLWGIGPFRLSDVDLPEGIVRGKKRHCRAKLAFAQAGPIEIELIEPGEGETTWSEFLRNKGEGVHHIAMWIDDMDKELDSYSKDGVSVLQFGDDKDTKFAYMDTEATAGVIFELLQHK